MDLKNKTIVITGGGRGLGRAMALAFAAKGANLAIVGKNEGMSIFFFRACAKS